MKWSFWIELYIRTHCVARGLRPLTLAAYEDALHQFREWVRVALADRAPDQLSPGRGTLEYRISEAGRARLRWLRSQD